MNGNMQHPQGTSQDNQQRGWDTPSYLNPRLAASQLMTVRMQQRLRGLDKLSRKGEGRNNTWVCQSQLHQSQAPWCRRAQRHAVGRGDASPAHAVVACSQAGRAHGASPFCGCTRLA
jgi:hypothetical protein